MFDIVISKLDQDDQNDLRNLISTTDPDVARAEIAAGDHIVDDLTPLELSGQGDHGRGHEENKSSDLGLSEDHEDQIDDHLEPLDILQTNHHHNNDMITNNNETEHQPYHCLPVSLLPGSPQLNNNEGADEHHENKSSPRSEDTGSGDELQWVK